MYNGVIISDEAPSGVTGYAWVKVLPDGTRNWYGFNKDTQSWELESTEPAAALPDHSHLELGDINFTGTVSADGEQGLTGEKVLGGYKFTFKSGLLVGFEPV